LDEPMEDSKSTRLDFLESDDDRPEAKIYSESLKQEIRGVLEQLEDRERNVLLLYFGLLGEEPKNLEEIGRQMRLSGERIRQIKNQALQRLRHNTRSHLLKIYLK